MVEFSGLVHDIEYAGRMNVDMEEAGRLNAIKQEKKVFKYIISIVKNSSMEFSECKKIFQPSCEGKGKFMSQLSLFILSPRAHS